MRSRAKTDANQRRIADALVLAGCTVVSLAAVGKGCPDLLVGYGHRNWLFEVKNPETERKTSKSPSHVATRERQAAWRGDWRGQVSVVRSVADAFRILGLTQ